MHRKMRILAVVTAAALAGCRSESPTSTLDQPLAQKSKAPNARSGPPELPAPADFVSGIDNPYLGFAAGKVFTYEGETADGFERIVVEVTRRTKLILGVTTTVIHDRAYLDGELIENTEDWFAQDEDGNVWYFGEATEQILDGRVVGTEGSWKAGVDGAQPGIIMLADPAVGDKYAQEDAPNIAEDQAKVISLNQSIQVQYGAFDNCLETQEWTPLERGTREFKFYAPGVGLLLEAQKKDGTGEPIELISVRP